MKGFEIIITIGTPSGPIQKTCNATTCKTLKGKNYWSKSLLLCDTCPIWQTEKQHKKELKNCKDRIENILYCAWEENKITYYSSLTYDEIKEKIKNLFREESIKSLI